MNRLWLQLVAAVLIPTASHANPVELGLQKTIDDRMKKVVIPFLEKTVNVNSGTLNPEGVRAMADLYEPRLKTLGFTTSRIDLTSVGRGCHLIGTLKGQTGKPALFLMGHLDTVFEKMHPFQKFSDLGGGILEGPGIADMKGGNLVLLEALEALHASGLLKGMNISVMFTGDEESPGQDKDGSFTTSRDPLVEVAKRSDYALSFEPMNGKDPKPVVARRGLINWILELNGKSGHSSLVFTPEIGAGTIFPISRIVDQYFQTLRGASLLTFNIGHIVGGTTVTEDTAGGGALKVAGKFNVVAPMARAEGDIRALDTAEMKRVLGEMQSIADVELKKFNALFKEEAKVSASVRMKFMYPAMQASSGNNRLLARLDQISQDYGFGALQGADPMTQGAADVAFIAHLVKGSIDGLGPIGNGCHTDKETMPVESLTIASKRAALLIYRLSNTP